MLADVTACCLTAVDATLTAPQHRLLTVLRDQAGTMKITQLADVLDVHPSTASRMVDRLITAGLVCRETNPESRREVLVDLTRAGISLVHQVDALRRHEITRILTGMPATDRLNLVHVLATFTNAAHNP